MLIEHRYLIASPPRVRCGFALYGAISAVCPAAHGAGWAIRQLPTGAGFVIRGPAEAPRLHWINLGGYTAEVSYGGSSELLPAPVLAASIVVIRLTAPIPDDRAAFRARVVAHIEDRARDLGAASVRVSTEEHGVRVHGRLVRGFAVRLKTPDPSVSLAVLERGIGGKRSMGCGVFFPAVEPC